MQPRVPILASHIVRRAPQTGRVALRNQTPVPGNAMPAFLLSTTIARSREMYPFIRFCDEIVSADIYLTYI